MTVMGMGIGNSGIGKKMGMGIGFYHGNGNGNGFMGMGGNGNRNSPSRTPLTYTILCRTAAAGSRKNPFTMERRTLRLQHVLGAFHQRSTVTTIVRHSAGTDVSPRP